MVELWQALRLRELWAHCFGDFSLRLRVEDLGTPVAPFSPFYFGGLLIKAE